MNIKQTQKEKNFQGFHEGLTAQEHARLKQVRSKQGGFSLPSVIVGSIIAAVLGGMALSSMWGSVDKATVAAEGSSIAEVKTIASGVIEDLGSFPTSLGTDADNSAQSRVSQLPKELKYQLVSLDADGTAGGNDKILALKAYATDAQGTERLKAVADTLDKKFDGAAGKTTGRFIYDDTCSAPDASDCYYVTSLTSKTGTMDLSSAKTNEATPAAVSAIPANGTASDITAPLN